MRSSRRIQLSIALVALFSISAALIIFKISRYPRSSSALSPDSVDKAIARAVRFLERNQLPSGAFSGLLCQDKELKQCVADDTPFYTTFVLHSFSLLPPGEAEKSRKKAVDFLLSAQHRPGIWGYSPKQSPRRSWYPPDLDDTACAHAALRRSGNIPEGGGLQTISAPLRAPGGGYYTWFGFAPEENELDCAVSANVLFALALEGHPDLETAEYLNRLMRLQMLNGCSFYYPRIEVAYYFLSRAYRDGGVESLEPSVVAASNYFLQHKQPDGSAGDASITACAALTWLNVGRPKEALQQTIAWLIRNQRKDGGWNASMVYGRTYVGQWFTSLFGSEAMTTALALEALIKWRAIEGGSST